MTRKGMSSHLARMLVAAILLAAIFGGPVVLLVFIAGRFGM